MNMRYFMLALLLLSPAVLAEGDVINKGDIALLALVDNGTGQSGSVAHLELELRPGDERVYLQTFPMTKITTQASLRFAQQVACSELDVDCSKYDFLFSIRAMPGIVGGPSAGSAAAVLTAALLMNKSIPDDVALTGTINSGGVVGMVGGIRQKVEAAGSNGIKRVYVPSGAKAVKDDNRSVSISEYGKVLNISVEEVTTLAYILEKELDVPQTTLDAPLKIDDQYSAIMKDVSEDLCDRNQEEIESSNLSKLQNFTERAREAFEKEEFYAAASYCFRANVEFRKDEFLNQNLTSKDIIRRAATLEKQAEDFRDEVERRELESLTDIQTYMAVMERIDEATTLLEDVKQSAENNDTRPSELAFAKERLFSAMTWSRFFNGTSNSLKINDERIRDGCAAKISEAEERYNYVKSVIPDALDGTRVDIDRAYGLLRSKNYTTCLHTAAKAKAEADVLLGLIGVEEQRFDSVIDLKLQVARQALMKAQEKDIFPIIAYSYYEYAKSLRDFDKVSSLLFSEYALELANLEIYFKENGEIKDGPPKSLNQKAGDVLAGILAIFLIISLLCEASFPRKKS